VAAETPGEHLRPPTPLAVRAADQGCSSGIQGRPTHVARFGILLRELTREREKERERERERERAGREANPVPLSTQDTGPATRSAKTPGTAEALSGLRSPRVLPCRGALEARGLSFHSPLSPLSPEHPLGGEWLVKGRASALPSMDNSPRARTKWIRTQRTVSLCQPRFLLSGARSLTGQVGTTCLFP
jgi:hypothetical protein